MIPTMKNYNNAEALLNFAYRKEEPIWNLEPGWMADTRYCVFLVRGVEGSVYLAFHEKLFRFYAVKELKKEGLCFSRESIEVWKTLKCAGLPEIVDILEDEETVWIVTEYIEGDTLAEYMKNGRRLSHAEGSFLVHTD